MKKLNEKIQKKFAEMCATGKLFRVELSGQTVWETYINGFVNDPVFRDPNSSTHKCNLCNNFLRRYGNIVSIDENLSIITMFDVGVENEYEQSMLALSKAIGASKITEVFFETFNELNSLPYGQINKSDRVFQLGVAKNVKRYTREEAEKYGVVKANEVREFHHLHIFVPKEFIGQSIASSETIMSEMRSSKEVFQRAMETISVDTLELVRDLINQGSLLDGQTHLHKIEQMLPLKKEYDNLKASQKDNWCWVKSYRLPIARFRNELIGVLCTELSEGKELNAACHAWNKRVDPINYMKTTAPITKKQIDEARKFVEENGYNASFNRRFATIDDIHVNEIMHSNVGDGKIKTASVFDAVKTSASTRHKRSEFDGVEEIPIEKFMKDVLPGCTSVEVFLKNSHEQNMVTLTTANDPESKSIFKWDNNYSWTFSGNLAGKSQIKQAVKDAGGNTEGVLNFRLAWNDADMKDNSDLDAWASEPSGDKIGYSTGFRKDRGNMRTAMSGQLDVDNTSPSGKMAVENITWTKKDRMRDGVYKFWVNQYRADNSHGFKIEIEFGGDTYCYEYNRPVSGNVQVAEVTLKNGKFTVEHKLPESSSSKIVYGLETNTFHKVNLVCLSPNHWGKNNVGNKHYLFMLEGAKTPTALRSFHNENLNADLATHRKVMEVLGATNMIEPKGKQLSGVGFNATIRDEVIVRLSGTHKRVVKIKF